MLDAVLNLFGGGVLGGLIGLAGAWLKAREERAKMELEQQHQKDMRQLDLQEMQAEADLKLRQTETEFAGKQAIAETEAEAAMDVAASQALTASYKHDKATYGIRFVDAIRGLMRPVITIYLLGILSLIAWQLYGIEAIASIDAQTAWKLFSDVVRDATFLAVTAVTWWFGSRPNSRASGRGR